MLLQPAAAGPHAAHVLRLDMWYLAEDEAIPSDRGEPATRRAASEGWLHVVATAQRLAKEAFPQTLRLEVCLDGSHTDALRALLARGFVAEGTHRWHRLLEGRLVASTILACYFDLADGRVAPAAIALDRLALTNAPPGWYRSPRGAPSDTAQLREGHLPSRGFFVYGTLRPDSNVEGDVWNATGGCRWCHASVKGFRCGAVQTRLVQPDCSWTVAGTGNLRLLWQAVPGTQGCLPVLRVGAGGRRRGDGERMLPHLG